jgi:hypothetical protein
VSELTVEKIPWEDDMEVIPVLGGDSKNPTWDEYFDEFFDKYKPHIILLKSREDLLLAYGSEQGDLCYKFSDGLIFGFSSRAWGDFRQAVINKKEGYVRYM